MAIAADRNIHPSPSSVDGLLELQELILSTDTLEVFLNEVAAAASRNLQGGRFSCGVTVRTHARRPTTLGTSDAFAAALDEAQYSQGQGPCLHALGSGNVVEIRDMAVDGRWPLFSRHAAAVGAGSSLSLPMSGATGVIGAFNIYSDRVDAFTDTDREQAGRYAQLATGAVALGVRLAQRAALTDDLRIALSSRAIIDQALGIVMGQRRCDAHAAFTVLRELSQTNNTKLRDVAYQVVLAVTGTVPVPTPGDDPAAGAHDELL